MTRFIHDQFAKQYLSELLSSFGTVKTSQDIASEVRQVDVYFTPSTSDIDARELGLLGQLIATPAIFEPFRNPITAKDIRTCLLKLLVLQAKWERERENTQLTDTERPRLWILTPTASTKLLESAGAKQSANEPTGIYYCPALYTSAIIVIHQLPRTPETLWLRLLGRGQVQEQAIKELEALPSGNRWRANVIKLVYELLKVLALRQDKEADFDYGELIVTLTELYEEAIAELREKVREQVRGEATLELIANVLQARFGEVDEELAAIIEAIAALPSEEFTSLVLQLSQLSREELLQRFRTETE